MRPKTKTLLKLKGYISQKLGVGVSRIRFNLESSKFIYLKDQTELTRSIADTLIKAKAIRIIPMKKRTYKIFYGRKKDFKALLKPGDKVKNTKSLAYLMSRKIITDKKIWIARIRKYRSILKSHKKLLGSKIYRDLRQKAKGNYFKKQKDLMDKLKNYEKSE